MNCVRESWVSTICELGTIGGLETHCWSLDQALIKGLEVEESTKTIGFLGFAFFISCINDFAKKRLIVISQFDFELRADVPIARPIGELSKQILVSLSFIFLSH